MARKRYPSNSITPHGWYSVVTGNEPMMWLDAYDNSLRIDLMGGLAIPDRYAAPECVRILKDGLSGLIPPWEHIDQKGATEDGVTQIDALYSPTEITMKLVCKGRDPRHARRVYRDTVASIDAIQQSKLNFVTHDMGHWWAPVRWFKGAPSDPLRQSTTLPLTLRLRADNAFWRTHDHVSTFDIPYDSITDDFSSDGEDAGEDWPVYDYEGTAGGNFYTEDGVLKWNPGSNGDQAVVLGPYKDFDTDSDIQVIDVHVGAMPQLIFTEGTYLDIWGRMGVDGNGDWDGNGIRARIGRNGIYGWVWLSRFNNFVETPLFDRNMWIPPLRTERYTLLCGTEDDERIFRILRNGFPVLTHKEAGENSELGEDYRGVGFGGKATAGDGSQAAPPWVTMFTADDHIAKTREGFLELGNIGDQPLYYDFTLIGPFESVRIHDGPESDEYVEFGPLLRNQVVELRTDPRVHTTMVEDLTVTGFPEDVSKQTPLQQALTRYMTFAGVAQTPFADLIRSIFGVRRVQGNLYRFLQGRFSKNIAIPPKSPGNPAQPSFVKVRIVGGDADSKIIAAGTPLRRWPL